MNINIPLSQREELTLRGRLGGEKVEYCLPYDLNERHSYVYGLVVITKTRLFMLEEGELVGERKIKDGRDYVIRESGGSGTLEYVDKETGEDTAVARFTIGNLKRVVYSEGILNSFAEDREVSITVTEDDDTCPHCGHKFIRDTRMCPKCQNRYGVLRRLLLAVRGQIPFYALILAMQFTASLIAVFQPEINRRMIDGALRPMHYGERAVDLGVIVYYVLLLALLSLVQMAIRLVSTGCSAFAASRLSKTFRNIVHEKIQKLSIRYLDTKQVGDLMNRINGDTSTIQEFMTYSATNYINEVVMMLVVGFTVFAFDWRLGLIVLAPMPVMVVALKMRRFHKMYRLQHIKLDRMESTLHNILSGIRVVKAFGQEAREIERFCGHAAIVRDITKKNEKYYYTLMPIINFAMGLGGYIVTFYCATRIVSGNLTIGEMVKFQMYAGLLHGRVGWMMDLPSRLARVTNSIHRIYEVIDEKIEIEDAVSDDPGDITGDIDVKDLSFGYLSYKPVLKNIELDVKKGEMIGIVGHSGAGKSTFINLLMRLYDADGGRILIDGKDLREYEGEDYKRQIGVVLQESFLFSGTVWENIIYSKPDATFEEVVMAAKIANAHDFIVKLPNGYDTRVGERGHSLSGGERQRVAIARAVIHNPRILILDEATASVDTETEQQIQGAFARLIKDRTTFAIAHRLSTLKNANRIMVIEKGNLAEIGTHKELMEKEDGIYHGLVMAQRRMSKIKAL